MYKVLFISTFLVSPMFYSSCDSQHSAHQGDKMPGIESALCTWKQNQIRLETEDAQEVFDFLMKMRKERITTSRVRDGNIHISFYDSNLKEIMTCHLLTNTTPNKYIYIKMHGEQWRCAIINQIDVDKLESMLNDFAKGAPPRPD